MEIRYSANPRDIDGYTTKQLREEFVYENFFHADKVTYMFSHIERVILGGVIPATGEVRFDDYIDAPADLGNDYLLAAREMAVINLAGDGYITVDGVRYDVGNTTVLYIGMGGKDVTFGSASYDAPAKFYFYSTPAHKNYPNKVVTKEMAVKLELGNTMDCNERVIHQYIRPDVCDSCQVLMGYTQLAAGSTWNSMPTHTHERRCEAYMYFNMKEDDRVIHLMGEPTNTRHLIIGNEQAVISPTWSIHTGVGSGSYGFIWGMAGENRNLGDAVAYKIADLA